MIGQNQGLVNCRQKEVQKDKMMGREKEQGIEKDKRLEQKLKELNVKCSKKYLAPFNFRGKYYTFWDNPQQFIKQKRLKQNSKNRINKSAKLSFGFKINGYSLKFLKELDYLKDLNVGDINQIQKNVNEVIKLQHQLQNICKEVIQLMDKIEQRQKEPKRQRYLQYSLQSKIKEYEIMYEGVILRYEEDSERFMEHKKKKMVFSNFCRKKKIGKTHQKRDKNQNGQEQMSESKQDYQDEEPPLQKYQRYIKNIHTEISRLNQKKYLLLKRLNGQTQEIYQQMSTFTPQNIKIESKREYYIVQDIQQEQEQADVSDDSSIQDSDFDNSRKFADLKQQAAFLDGQYLYDNEPMSPEDTKSKKKQKEKRKKKEDKVLQVLKNLKTHKEKIKYIEQNQPLRSLQSFSLRGIKYDYYDDPEDFLRQKRIKCYIYLYPQRATNPSNPLSYILQSKIQPVQLMFNTSYKEGIHKDNSQYHKKVEYLIGKVNKLQKKCWEIRQQVIDLMKAQKLKEGLTRQEKENILCIQPDPVCSEFQLFDRFGINSPAYKDVYDQQKIRLKTLHNFWFEGVFFDYEEDPNRLKKYMKKKQEERKRYLYMKRKQNEDFDGKEIQIKKWRKGKRAVDILKDAEKYQQQIKNEEREKQQNHIGKLQKYFSNLKVELKRLNKKKERLTQQKNQQNEKKVIQQIQEKNMIKVTDEKPQNINTRNL